MYKLSTFVVGQILMGDERERERTLTFRHQHTSVNDAHLIRYHACSLLLIVLHACILLHNRSGVPEGGHKIDRLQRLNDVWVRGRSAPNRLYNKRCFSVQFVQVLTNLWYSQTYSLVTLPS